MADKEKESGMEEVVDIMEQIDPSTDPLSPQMKSNQEARTLPIEMSPLRPRLRRMGSKTSLYDDTLLVGQDWDVSPSVRRNSLIFTKSPSTGDLRPSLAHFKELRKSWDAKKEIFEEPRLENEFTLEELAQHSLLESVYGGKSDGWELLVVREHVWVYKKDMGGKSSPGAFKAEITIDHPPKDLADFLASGEGSNWVDDSSGWKKESRVIETLDDGHSRVTYTRFYGTSETSPRDYVMLGTNGVTENGSKLFCEVSIDHKDVPEVPGVVRGEMLCRGWVIFPIVGVPSTSLVTLVVQYDPKGYDVSEEKKDFIAIESVKGLKWLEDRVNIALKKKQTW